MGILLLFASAVTAQINITATLNSSGGNIQSGATHCEWSVGEMSSVGLLSTTGIQFTNGILQGSLQLATSVPVIAITRNELQFYPNPVSHILLGRFQFSKPGVVYIKLTDVLGRNVVNWKSAYSSGSMVQLYPVAHLTPGIYVAEVIFVSGNGHTQKGNYTILKQ